MSVLAIVPARGGSKGLPGKHLLDLGGRPVIAWTAEAAAGAELVDRAILSTDDPDIAAAGEAAGLEVPFMRPAELGGDDVPTIDVLRHAWREAGDGHDTLVLLQATSPLRTAADVDAAIRLRAERGAPACISVAEAHPHPAWTHWMDASGELERVIEHEGDAERRQDLRPAFGMNGAIYVEEPAALIETGDFTPPGTVGYAMPPERSVDIDSELDLDLARAVVARTR